MATKNFYVHDGLKVKGNSLLNGSTFSDSASAKLHVKTAANGASANLSNVNGLIIENSGSGNTNYALKLATGAGNILNVTNSGRVGIGITNPERALHVKPTSNVPAIKVGYDGTQGNGSLLEFDNGYTQKFYVGMSDTYASRDFVIAEISTGSSTDATNPKYVFNGNGDGSFYITDAADNDICVLLNTNGDSYLNGGNVGIGTTSPTRALTVGSTCCTTGNIINLTSSTSGYVQLAFGDSDDDNRSQILYDNNTDNLTFQTGGGTGFDNGKDRLVIDNTGNVGIGITNPGKTLHVYTSDDIISKFSSSDAGGRILINDSTTNAYINAASGVASIGQINGLNNSNVNILSSGFVGIGTTGPDIQLHVQSSSSTFAQVKVEAGADGHDSSVAYAQAGSIKGISGYDDSTNTVAIKYGTFGGSGIDIDSSGNVGIGTTDPTSLLHIDTGANSAANFRLGANRTVANAAVGQLIGDWNGTVVAKIALKTGDDTTNKDDGEIAFEVAAAGTTAEAMRIQNDGNVGIGTTNPNNKMTIRSSSSALLKLDRTDASYGGALNFTCDNTQKWAIKGGYDASCWDLSFLDQNNTSRLTITQGGLVGIGTYRPNEKLTVSGNVSASGVVYADTFCANSGSCATIDFNDNLDVDGYITATQDISSQGCFYTSSGSNVALLANNYLRSCASGTFYFDHATVGRSFQFRTSSNSALDTTAMTITSSGYVGLGVIPTNQRLTLNGNFLLYNNKEIRQLDTGGLQRTIIKLDSSNDLNIGGSYSGALKFIGGGSYSEVMRIHDDGNVGIGTASPSAKLDIGGVLNNPPTIRLTNTTTSVSLGDSLGEIQFYNSDDTDFTPGVFGMIRGVAHASGGEGSIQILTDMPSEGTTPTNVTAHFNTDGKVGIGITAPEAPLHILGGFDANNPKSLVISGREHASAVYSGVQFERAGGGTFFGIGNDSRTDRDEIVIGGGFGSVTNASSIKMYTGELGCTVGTTRMVITSSGSVGFGTNAPNQSFTVATGRANFDEQNNYYGVWIDGDTSAESFIGVGSWYSVGGRVSDEGGNHLSLRTHNTSHNLCLQCTGGATVIGGAATICGTATFHGSLDLQDNDKLLLGSGNDLEIYHNGSDSYISDVGTGHLILATNSGFLVKSSTEKLIEGYPNGAVSLYYDNSKKLETTSAGVCITDDVQIAGNLIVHGTCSTLNTTVTATSAMCIHNAGTGPALQLNQTGSQPIVDLQDDGTSAFYIEDGGNVGIGTNDPAQKLHVCAVAAVCAQVQSSSNHAAVEIISPESTYSPYLRFKDNCGERYVAYSDTDHKLHFRPSGTSTASEWITFSQNGGLGVGTSTPAARLEVKNTAASGGTFKFSDGSSRTLMDLGGGILSWNAGTVFGAGSWAGTADHEFRTLGTSRDTVYIGGPTSGSNHALYVDGMCSYFGGSVGIGTTTPERKLHVFKGESGGQTSNSDSSLVLENSSHTYLQFLTPSTVESGLLFGDGNNDVGALVYDHADDEMRFIVNAAVKTVIDSSGNVGIGTDDPSSALHIEKTLSGDSSQLEITNGCGAAIKIGITGSGANENAHIKTHSGEDLEFQIGQSADNASPDVVFKSGGNVGIGTTNPTRPLSIYRSTEGSIANFLHYTDASTYQGLYINVSNVTDLVSLYSSGNSGGGFNFFTGNTERMRLTAAGNVGIGTTNPERHLHVEDLGQIKLENNSTGNWAGIDLKTSGGTCNYTGYFGMLDSNGNFFIDVGSNGDDVIIRQNGETNIGLQGKVLVGRTTALNTANKLHVDNAIALGSSLYTFNQVIGNGANLELVSNANPANIGTNSNIIFKLGTSGGGGPNEAMRIESTGDVGIGTTDPDAHVHVKKSVGATTVLTEVGANSTVGYEIKKTGSTTQHWKIVDGQTVNGRLEFYDATNCATRLSISSSGSITFNSAYTFPTSDGSAGQVLTTDGNGALSFSSAGSGTISGSGTDNYIPRFNGTTALENSSIYDNGNVGIGTTDPQSALHIKRTAPIISLTDCNSFSDANDRLIFRAGADQGLIQWYDNSANTTSHIAVFNSDGNVGINTSVPAFSSGGGGIEIERATATLRLQHPGSHASEIYQNTSALSIADLSSGTIRFLVANSECARLNGTGLGLGTTSPCHKLHVVGQSVFANNGSNINIKNTWSSGNHDINFIGGSTSGGSANNTAARIRSFATAPGGAAVGDLLFTVNCGDCFVDALYIEETGHVGIGTTDPGEQLHIYGADAEMELQRTGSYADTINFGMPSGVPTIAGGTDLALGGNGKWSEAVRIKSTGKVGIGTTNPGKHLDVVGEAKIDTTANNAPALCVSRNAGVSSVSATGAILTNTAVYINGNEDTGSDALRIGSMNNGTGDYFIDASNYNATAAYDIMLQPFVGNVGIGTTTTACKLHVQGCGADTRIYLEDGASGAPIYMRSMGSGEAGLYLGGEGSAITRTGGDLNILGNNVDIEFSTNAGSCVAMRIDTNHDVGIGTTNSSARLDIRDAATDGQEVLRIQSSGNVNDGGYHWMTSEMATGQTTDANIIHLIGRAECSKNSGYFGFNYQADGADCNFLTLGGYAANNLLNITMGGNVGIGTTQPQVKLEVYGDGEGINLCSNDYMLSRLIPRGSGAAVDGGLFSLYCTGTECVRIDSGGNSWIAGGYVGIGTNAVNYPLEVTRNNGGLVSRIYNTNTNGEGVLIRAGDAACKTRAFQVASTNDTKRFTVNSDGTVGIGITNPSHTLQVNGETKSTHFITGYDWTAKTGGIHIGNDGLTTGAISFYNGSDSSGNIYRDSDTLYVGARGGTATQGLAIDGSGCVGIGTATPYNRLHVNGNARINSLIVGNSGANNTPTACLHIKSSGTAASLRIEDSDSSNQVYDFLVDQGVGFKLIDKGTGSSTNTRLAIDTSGNVGIGVTNPGALLEVCSVGTCATFTNIARFRSGPDENATGAEVFIGHQGNSRGLIIQGGRGGEGAIGDDSAVAHFCLNRSGGAIPSTTQDHIMTLRQGGSVGIGTTCPGSNNTGKLFVGTPPTTGSSAIAQFGGFVRGNYFITHDSTYGIFPNTTCCGSVGKTDSVYKCAHICKIIAYGGVCPSDDGQRPLGGSSYRWSNVHAVCTTTGAVIESNLCTPGIDSCPQGSVVVWRDGKLQGTTQEYDYNVMGVTAPDTESPIVMGAEPILVTGDIQEGDPIVTSSKINHGMKGDRACDLHGKVIAQALESGSGESYMIQGMIRKF